MLKTIKKTCTAGLIFISASSSFAGTMCDIPDTWDGFYAGIQAGYNWSQYRWHFANANFFNTDGLLASNDFQMKGNGFSGGGTLGYNWDYYSWVAGVELGFAGIDMKARRISPFFPNTDTFRASSKWYGTLRARFGHAHEDWLLYIIGGWVGSQASLNVRDTVANIIAKESKWLNGWTIGTGVEFRMNANFSIGVEYDYMQFSSNNIRLKCDACLPLLAISPIVNVNFNNQVTMVKLNYLADDYWM